jgi:hypothetical protein
MNTVRTQSVKAYTRRSMLSAIYVQMHEELEREFAEKARTNRLLRAMDAELREIVRRDVDAS